MSVEEVKTSLAKTVMKEFCEMESKRREDQYKDVLQNFKKNTREGNGYSIFWHTILYDDVRERLQKDGFNVEVITSNSGGRAAYHISINKELMLELNKNSEMLSANLL